MSIDELKRPRLCVGDDDFSVDDALINRKRFHRARDFGKDFSVVVAVSREQQRFAA